MEQQNKFSKRFTYENTYIDFTVELEFYLGDDDAEINAYVFKNPTFEFRLDDVNDNDSIENFMHGYCKGGNSYTEFGPNKKSGRFVFYNRVSGNGGDSSFTFSVPMEVAIKMHELIMEAKKCVDYINSQRTT